MVDLASEMTQPIKTLVTKPDGLILIPRRKEPEYFQIVL